MAAIFRATNKTRAAMSYSTPVNVNAQADSAKLADAPHCTSPVSARELSPGLDSIGPVRVPAEYPQHADSNLSGREFSGPFKSNEDHATLQAVTRSDAILAESSRLSNLLSFAVDSEKKHAQEMAIASEVQRMLLPQHMPPLQTLDYAGSCEPAWSVGGDYYDFLDMGSGRVGFVLADVSGKGVSAALLMANLQASVRSQYVIGLENLEKLFRTVNRLFYESVTPGFFATMFFADYLDTTRKLRYVNCGHCPALLIRADGVCEKLGSTATVLGIFENWNCTVGEATMSSGDILVAYSDGVTEAQSGSGELFGDERLLAAVEANRNFPAAGLLKAIATAAHNFGGKKQDDDLTLLVARAR
jgi:serine phosphatase RsbU (regulator of sigma subunit)